VGADLAQSDAGDVVRDQLSTLAEVALAAAVGIATDAVLKSKVERMKELMGRGFCRLQRRTML